MKKLERLVKDSKMEMEDVKKELRRERDRSMCLQRENGTLRQKLQRCEFKEREEWLKKK